MEIANRDRIKKVIHNNQAGLLSDWMQEQLASTSASRPDLISQAELRQQSSEFVNLFEAAVESGNLTDIQAAEWAGVREFLAGLSRSRAERGFSPRETATFIFSFKQPLFDHIRQAADSDSEALVDDLWAVGTLLDRLGLYTTEIHQKNREEIIRRQQDEIMELSTPVVKLWQGILAVPLIGTLDSVRTQIVMENLLQEIMATGSDIAIIDITGVPVVDTLVAQHLLKTVAAARLMGADCIISGIRPQIAQTMVALGVQFNVKTKPTLAAAFEAALQQLALKVVPA